MFAIVNPSASTNLGARPVGFAATTMRWIGALLRSVANRRQVHGLMELTDRELRDIGLTRDDVRVVLETPLIRDPSMILSVRTIERRASLRAGRLGDD